VVPCAKRRHGRGAGVNTGRKCRCGTGGAWWYPGNTGGRGAGVYRIGGGGIQVGRINREENLGERGGAWRCLVNPGAGRRGVAVGGGRVMGHSIDVANVVHALNSAPKSCGWVVRWAGGEGVAASSPDDSATAALCRCWRHHARPGSVPVARGRRGRACAWWPQTGERLITK
jgi:hypothetical protein